MIDDRLDALYGIVETALGDGWAGYGFQAVPAKVTKAFAVTYVGGTPNGRVIGASGRFYDFAIGLFWLHDNSRTELEAAERGLNAAEDALIAALDLSRGEYWRKVTWPQASDRPTAYGNDLSKYRIGRLFPRLLT